MVATPKEVVHITNCNDNHAIEFRSMMQWLEVETLKTKDRVVVATKELERVIELVKNMSGVPKQTINLENDVRDDDDYDVENLITSKTKGRPKGSRPKGELKLQKSHVIDTLLIVSSSSLKTL
ncbi:hypothetical protein Lal_00016767, partial [Lupinus albus]